MSKLNRRLFVAALAACFALATTALAAEKRFVDSDDAKEKDEPQKFLPDYDKLVKGKDCDWVYFPEGSLKKYKSVQVNEFGNTGKGREAKEAASYGKEYMEQWLQREGFEIVEKGADLVVDGNVFNAWEPGTGARVWGGWAANPGVGLEVMVKDKAGKVLGEMRDKARGSTLHDAVENGLEDVTKDIAKGK